MHLLLLRQGELVEPYEMIAAEKDNHPVAMMCKQLGVSRSGYYASKRRGSSTRQREDAELVTHIKESHTKSRGTYGCPRVHDDLKDKGLQVGRKRVARLMRQEGLTGDAPKPFRRTTDSKHNLDVADNLLDRKFEVEAPDQAWVTDITYVRTWQGWLYLAVVIDLLSRRVVGWSTATHMKTSLVLGALKMALGHRLPRPGMLHHSDRGSQYASHDYRDALEKHNIVCSMSRKGNCWDNAVAESFFGTLKQELLHRRPWPSPQRARAAIAEYIEIFYNRQRKHSTLGYVSPVEFEKRFEQEAALAA